MTPLDRASQPLRDANANILVIGIGKQPDIRELNLITKNPQDVEIIPSPDEVLINVHVLARQLRVDSNEGKGSILPFFLSLLSFSCSFVFVAGERVLSWHFRYTS